MMHSFLKSLAGNDIIFCWISNGNGDSQNWQKIVKFHFVNNSLRDAWNRNDNPGSCLRKLGFFVSGIQGDLTEFLGHTNVNTTIIYTHVLNRGVHGISSPVDNL
jgi:hypothetical protein